MTQPMGVPSGLRGAAVTSREQVDLALRDARVAAYPGEYVGQESFMSAEEILALGRAAGIGPGVDVLDLCCGIAGPGRHLVQQLGCRYLGVDQDPDAVTLARRRSSGLPCRFVRAAVPPLPAGEYDVVLLLETLLAFQDKGELVFAVARALRPGGRFACTMEEGTPLTDAERAVMPQADTVWPIPWSDLVSLLGRAGLRVTSRVDNSRSHLRVVERLVEELTARRAPVVAQVGAEVIDELLAGHRLWASWLRAGRIRKIALVALGT